MDAAVRMYAPDPPLKGWTKKLLITAAIVWLVGSVAYGGPLINRWTNVHHTQVVAQQDLTYGQFLKSVAGLEQPASGELDRLESLVVKLRGPGYPDVAALRRYRVFPGQFPHASNQFGFHITTQGDPSKDFGYFQDRFIVDVVGATAGQVNSVIPHQTVRSWGNLRWEYLAEAAGLLWIVVLLACMVLWTIDLVWRRRFEKQFVSGLPQIVRDVLDELRYIVAHPKMPHYQSHLATAKRLLDEVREGFSTSRPERDVKGELADLRENLEDTRRAYRRAGNEPE